MLQIVHMRSFSWKYDFVVWFLLVLLRYGYKYRVAFHVVCNLLDMVRPPVDFSVSTFRPTPLAFRAHATEYLLDSGRCAMTVVERRRIARHQLVLGHVLSILLEISTRSSNCGA